MTIRLAAAAFLLALIPASAQRLPANATPQHYTLRITPQIAADRFSGSESIALTLAAPSASITLNSAELTLSDATIDSQPATIALDPAREQSTFTAAQPLPAGPHVLSVSFAGAFNQHLRGFYLARSKTRAYAVTQFEATDARRAFPCFDEPALKATFDLSLTVDKGDSVIANMPQIADHPAGPAQHTVAFAPTPRMSTYLVAFLVGDFACTKGKSDGTAIRVCSTPDQVQRTKFALDAAKHFLAYYNSYFGIRYPLPKLDLIGIPDFEAGAMENFGAITYRETDLLADAKHSTLNTRKRVAIVVAHEMAHQWFGDLVTMNWWDNLWLNEGFATWMETKAAAEWHPDWGFDLDRAVTLADTLSSDSDRTTRPIRARADTPDEIDQMFDSISYGKAGAVIGMVEHWIGPDPFRAGVHSYLQAHLYSNATAEDFWTAETTASAQPVDRVMSSFVSLPGVPLVSLRPVQPDGYPLAITRFLLPDTRGGDRRDAEQAQDVSVGWTIPVCPRSAPCSIITRDTAVYTGRPLPYLNGGYEGYFRTAYPPEQLARLTATPGTLLSPQERIGLLSDQGALVRAGMADIGTSLTLAVALRDDSSADVLDIALNALTSARVRVADPEDANKLDGLIRARFGPVYAVLPPESKHEAGDLADRRSELFRALGDAGDPTILAQARLLTDQLFSGHRTQQHDLLDEAVALAAIHGDDALYGKLQVLSNSASDPGLRSESLQLLARFTAPVLVIRTLEYAVSGQVKKQDAGALISSELRSPLTQETAWYWLTKNWSKVATIETPASGASIVSSTASFCTVQKESEVAEFFAKHPVESSSRPLAQALDSIRACAAFRAAQQMPLKRWLLAQP